MQQHYSSPSLGDRPVSNLQGMEGEREKEGEYLSYVFKAYLRFFGLSSLGFPTLEILMAS